MTHIMAAGMIPGELELAIPGNIGFFKVLLVVSFVLHILFVNLMVAGGLMAVFNEWRGWRSNNEKWDRLAQQLSVQVSIHKSLAVVLGVAPLLIISVIYTPFFYTSTILIGKAWIMLIVIITVAFLMFYVYKFTWERWKNKKGLHLFFGIGGTVLLLYVALVFITNVTAMLQPELWQNGQSVFTAFFHYPTIWQRFFHFLFATLAVMGLYLAIFASKQKGVSDDDRKLMGDFGKNAAFLFTTLQLVAGPVLLFSLKPEVRQLFLGESALATTLVIAAVILALGFWFALYQYKKLSSGKWLSSALVMFVLVVGMMGWLRHEVRDSYLAPYDQPSVASVEQQGEEIVQTTALLKD